MLAATVVFTTPPQRHKCPVNPRMAKLKSMPSQDVIDMCRGVLDFYRWCELVIVRAYPQWTLTQRAPAVVAAEAIFSYARHTAPSLPQHVIQTWQDLADRSNLTWIDWLTRAYIAGTLESPQTAP